MNCKPGDLAIVINTPRLLRHLVGRIVRVTTHCIEVGDVCWEYEGERLTTHIGSRIDLIEDEFLRPIRPDSVTDDEVRELYAPTVIEAAPALGH